LPIIPSVEIENYMFWNGLMMRLVEHREEFYGPALDLEKWDKNIECAQRRHDQFQEDLRKKKNVLKNVDSCLEDDDFDKPTCKKKHQEE